MAISASELRPGMAVLIGSDLHLVLEYQHVKPGKGPAFVRIKLKSVKTQSIVSKTHNPDARFDQAFILKRDLQFQYSAGDQFHFMDLGSYEQLVLSRSQIEDAAPYLIENMEIKGSFHESNIVGVDLPTSVVLEISESEPGHKGDTSKAAMKPATMETGLKVQVPLFIGPGDKIRVDTRTGEYLGRA